jgi:hypothetical protein
MRKDGSASFCSIERVEGTLGRRSGTFLLQHDGGVEGSIVKGPLVGGARVWDGRVDGPARRRRVPSRAWAKRRLDPRVLVRGLRTRQSGDTRWQVAMVTGGRPAPARRGTHRKRAGRETAGSHIHLRIGPRVAGDVRARPRHCGCHGKRHGWLIMGTCSLADVTAGDANDVFAFSSSIGMTSEVSTVPVHW